MRQRTAIPDSDWRDGFLFVGNHLALDFLNTQPVQNGEPMELLSDFSALLRWFQAAGLLNSRKMANLQRQTRESVAGRRTLDAMRQFREKLRKEILAWEGGAPLFGTMVRTAPTRRLVCPLGTERGEIVRKSGSEPRSQVWTVRAAFL